MDISAGNLYQANKQLVLAHEKPLNHLELAGVQPKLEKFFEDKVHKYAMLLCHEQRDYTIFNLDEASIVAPHTAASEVMLCCTNRGEVYSIEETEDGVAFEIWIKIDDDAFCYYLFPYDQAVIECA